MDIIKHWTVVVAQLASNTRGPQFESNHRQSFVLNVRLQFTDEKMKIK